MDNTNNSPKREQLEGKLGGKLQEEANLLREVLSGVFSEQQALIENDTGKIDDLLKKRELLMQNIETARQQRLLILEELREIVATATTSTTLTAKSRTC